MANNTSPLGNFRSLRFPENVGTDEVPAYIRFVPQKIEFGGTQGLNTVNRPEISTGKSSAGQASGVGSLGDYISSARQELQQKIGGAFDSFATAAKDSVNAIGNVFSGTSFTQIQNDLGKIISGRINVGIFNVNIGIKTEQDKITSLGSINIFLPNDLNTKSSVNYSAKELGQGQIAVMEKIQSTGDISMGDTGKIFGAFAVDKIKEKISKSSIGAAATLVTGKALNNFSFQVFEGVGHREFTYSFKMVAKSEKESLEIKTICDTFLFLMLPARSQTDVAGVNVQLYDIPCQWQIDYQYKGNRMSFHQQPGPSFLKSVDVKYGGDTKNNLYNDGAPMDVTLDLNFVEIEPLYRGNSLAVCT